MKRRITPVKALSIGVLVLVLLLIGAVVAATVYSKQRRKAYNHIPDTRDLQQRIEKLGNEYVQGHQHASVVIAVSTRSNVFYKGFSLNGTNTPGKESIYEIGSISKIFTAALLAKLEEEHLLSSTNTVIELLPPSVSLPATYTNITLNHLVTHTAGLPRLPDNLLKLAKDQQNPYKDYGTNELYAALQETKLESTPGSKLQYSNFGYGLLGHLMELKTGKNYANLIKDYITEPLGLRSTYVYLPESEQHRLVPGHDSRGQTVPYWDFQVLAPSGAIKSTAEDLIRFSRANLDKELPLYSTLTNTHKIRFRGLGGVVGWGWHSVRTLEDLDFLWHNGGTGGFVSFIGLDPRFGHSVVILSNSGDAMDLDGSVDKMGMEILKLATKISLE